MLTVIVAGIAFFTIYDFPETASFLTDEEKAFLAYRLRYEGQDAKTDNSFKIAQNEKQEWRFARAAFTDWQIWVRLIGNSS